MYGNKTVLDMNGATKTDIITPTDPSHMMDNIETAQYNVKRGLKEFGQKGAEAVMSELKQLDDMSVLEPTSTLSPEQRHDALAYLMFLKRKRCGRIKGRGCADGRKQREHTNKQDASSPTVSLEALILTCLIDAKEGRKVTTCDVPGAFMHADQDELVHVRFEGPMAEILVKVNPKLYRPHILIEKGKKVLYARLRKALYGTLRAALLFWQDLRGFLLSLGFEPNPYDDCVVNMTIDDNQCTVVWHVDDLKISHMDQAVIDSLVLILNGKYGTHKPLTVTNGTKHEDLGMTLDYSLPGKVVIDMSSYIRKVIGDARPDMDGRVFTLAAANLFEVNETAPKLPEEEADYFHHMVARLLFVCKRTRPDIQTAIAFLSTRVRAPDRDDYKKLTRVIRYLRSCPEMNLTLEANNALVIKWYVDGSFAVHPDMKSHTGATMIIGKGSTYSTSQKQKINTRSSTEAELVAVNDAMGQILWTKYFLESQGYEISNNILEQDNKSALLLEKNGRASSGKRTRHINIRYFFVQDRIASGDMTVEHCPTEEMIGDFFTKPLQGAAFKKFRDAILNNSNGSTLQECVGNQMTSPDKGRKTNVQFQGLTTSDKEKTD